MILGHYSVRTAVIDMDIMSNSPLFRTESEIKHNAIIYQYPCGITDLIISSGMDFGEAGWEVAADQASRPKPSKRQKGKKSEGDDMIRSMRRARAKLRRLALANSFDYFVTLTFDPQKVDSFDPAAVAKALGRWCDNMVRRNGLKYILVPELHQSGRIHLHGFFSGRNIIAEDSGHIDSCGHPVYNLPQWGYGFSTAIQLYGEYGSAVGYVCKYIGKVEGVRPMGRWYYSGGALIEPEKVYAEIDYREAVDEYFFVGPLPKGQKQPGIVADIPGRKLLVIHTKQEENL